MDPTSGVLFKWCRSCDRHYARCRCAQPEFFLLSGGQEIPLETLKTLTGEPLDPAILRRR